MGIDMETEKKKLKVYCETSFWSWLVSRPSTDPDHAVKQAWTRKWWEEVAPKCEIFVSQHVVTEAMRGNAEQSSSRMAHVAKCQMLNGEEPGVVTLAKKLLQNHAIPEGEVADAFHIATAAVFGMDILLTWNCRHMANMITLPKTVSVVVSAGYECPRILTPKDALEVNYD